MARITTGLDPLTGDPVFLKDDASGKDLWFPLQPIGTEGQTASSIDPQFPNRPAPKQYSLWQVAIPMGVHLDFIINKSWVIGAEIGFRMTFTDYLDDVSGYYYDRSNNFQAIADANPTIKATTGFGGKTINAPVTFDVNGTTHNTAAILSAPSVLKPGNSYDFNDALFFPDARRGIINTDWYIPLGLKVSKVFGYNKYEKQAKKAMKEEEKLAKPNKK
jgi:hypothetical protein